MSEDFKDENCFITLAAQLLTMGFKLFGRKEKGDQDSVFSDRIYMNTAAKMSACLALANAEPATVFITWFSDSAKKLKEYFTANGSTGMNIVEAHHGHSALMFNKTVVFAEHHPLHEKEKSLVANWEQKKFIVFSALDEPLFARFGSEKIVSMMKSLGMKEDEAIEHGMVSRAILNAQEKIARSVIMEQSANSQADWMTKNTKAS